MSASGSRTAKPKGGSVKSGTSIKVDEKGPSVVDVRNEPVEYMPQPIVARYQEALDTMLANPAKFSESDQADIWERLGVAQFYFGVYRKASVSLQSSFDLRKKMPYSRSSARIALLLGSCHYRVGLLDAAVSTLDVLIKAALKGYPDICCVAYGNLSLALMSISPPRLKEAMDNGKKGLELALKVAKGNKGADIVLQLTRILISMYLKAGEIAKAEVLIFTFGFPKAEAALLKAGVKFAAGSIEDANSVIDMYLEDKKKDDEELARRERAQREKEEAKATEEAARKQKLLQAAADATAAATAATTTTERSANPDLDEQSPRSSQNRAGGQNLGKGDEQKEDGRRRAGAGTSTSSSTSAAGGSSKSRAAGLRKEGDDEEKSVASYHTGLLSESDGEEEPEEEEGVAAVDTRTQKERWADEDFKAAAAAQAKADEEAEKGLAAYSLSKAKLDSLLTEAKCIYNLSVLSSRQYSQKEALMRLQAAESAVAAYISLQEHTRLSSGKGDENDMAQAFLDAPLNVTPLCETLDESAEPYIVLSHILFARAETHLLLANQSKRDGMAVNRGLIFNRALPGVSNGNDFDPEDSRRSQVYDEKYEDPQMKEARVYFSKSEAVLDETNLVRDVVSFETTREVEKDPLAAKKMDENGQEVFELPVTETITTVLKPHDLNVAAVQKDAYRTMLDAMQGPTHFKRIQDTAIKELRSQYGVKLTERGTKSHQNARVDYKTQYVSTYHDPVSIRAEVMPLPAALGRDDVSLWIEWCLSASGGLGMGVFGTSFGLPVNKAQLQKEMAEKAMADLSSQTGSSVSAGDDANSVKSKNDAAFKSLDASSTIGSTTAFPSLKPASRPTEAFLKEVRGRLSEVEGMLSAKFDQSELDYRPRDKELRILLNICLARINAQLNLKRDCELAVDMLEELAKDMQHRTQNSHDGFYVALASRYRYELEEAKVPSGMSTEATAAKRVELLVFAKEYVKTAEKCKISPELQKKKGDLGPDTSTADTLLRDAYKKCINLYVELAATPLPDKGGGSKAKDKDKDKDTISLSSVVEEKGTMDMLNLYGDDEIKELEEGGDMAFFRKFGRLRATQLFLKLKACKG